MSGSKQRVDKLVLYLPTRDARRLPSNQQCVPNKVQLALCTQNSTGNIWQLKICWDHSVAFVSFPNTRLLCLTHAYIQNRIHTIFNCVQRIQLYVWIKPWPQYKLGFLFSGLVFSGLGIFHTRWTNLNSWNIGLIWRVKLVSHFLLCNNSSNIKTVALLLRRAADQKGSPVGHRRSLSGIPCDLPHFPISSSSITVSHKLINFQSWTLQGTFLKHLFSIQISVHKLLEVQGGCTEVSPEGVDRALWASSGQSFLSLVCFF